MSNKAVKDFRRRRYSRLMSRMDDDDEGHWITTENGHKVHINAEGEPDIGNSHVLAAMKGEGGHKQEGAAETKGGGSPQKIGTLGEKESGSSSASKQSSLEAIKNKDGTTDYMSPETGEIVKTELKNGDVIHPVTGKVLERGEQSKTLLSKNIKNPENPKRPSYGGVEKAWKKGLSGIAGGSWGSITNDMWAWEFPAGTKLEDCTSAVSNQLRMSGYSTDILKNGKISVSDPKDDWHSFEITIGKDPDNSMKGKSYYDIEVLEVL